MSKKEHLVTPNLEADLIDFKAHLEVANAGTPVEPILIVGASGTGKSIFLDRFKEFESVNGRPEPETIDCSIFIGADPGIAKSQLFGHVKGAFTGADKDKPGLIQTAAEAGKALILDEIGELPQEVQAMLLIFVETGEYRPVGSTKKRRCNTRIIAATNREKQLRKELKNRFFKFYIPNLYKRRGDILFYFALFFEDVFQRLNCEEIMTLLGYNWPGNVRELKQVGLTLRSIRLAQELKEKPAINGGMAISSEDRYWLEDAAGLYLISSRKISKLTTETKLIFYQNELDAGVNIDKLNQILIKKGVSFVWENPKISFKKQPFNLNSDIWIQGEDQTKTMSFKHQKAIFEATEAFRFMCSLLSLDEKSPKDIFTIKNRKFNRISSHVINTFNIPTKYQTHVSKISKQVRELLSKDNASEHKIDLTKFTNNELIAEYCSQLLTKTNNNITKAAKLADVPLSTFRNRLEKLDL